MKDPVFVVPATPPQSYSDFYRLIELSGLATCAPNAVDFNKDCAYIHTFHTTMPVKQNSKAKTILWFLERPASSGGPEFQNFMKRFMGERNIDEVWLSDRAMTKTLPEVNCKFVPIGTEEGLGTVCQDKNYDCAHLAYIERGSRREFLWGLTCNVMPNCWGAQRSELLSKTKFIFNVHQDADAYFEPLRFAIAAAHGVPVISENCLDPFPFVAGTDYHETNYPNLLSTLYNANGADYTPWRDMGMRMRDKAIKEFRFRDNVLRAMQ